MIRVATLFAVSVLLVAPARGDELAAEGKRHRAAAKSLFATGKFAEALAEYRTAYQLTVDADLLFDIGLCQESLHDDTAAAESYRKFLAARPKAKDRKEIEARIAALEKRKDEKRVEPAKVDLTPPPPAATAPAATAPAPAPVDTTPIWKRWYVWAAVAAAVVVIGVGVGIGVSLRGNSGLTFDGVVAH